MRLFKIFTTEEFDKDYSKLDNELQKRIGKEIDQLQENPYAGKPLGFKFFREKKIGSHRVYFLVYEEYVVVFIIALSDKKDQQQAINSIKELIPHYRTQIEKMFKK